MTNVALTPDIPIRREIEGMNDPADLLAARDQSGFWEDVGRRTHSLELQNAGWEARIRCERRLGKVLAEMPKNEGAKGSGSNQYEVRSHDVTAPTLSDLGISKMQSSRWQQTAAMSEELLERYMAECRNAAEEMTTAGLFKLISGTSSLTCNWLGGQKRTTVLFWRI